ICVYTLAKDKDAGVGGCGGDGGSDRRRYAGSTNDAHLRAVNQLRSQEAGSHHN
ncbi:unnamed protein product, partial [Ceratitis capitata]